MARSFPLPSLVYIILWFIGILFGSIEIYFYVQKRRLAMHGVATMGVVVDYFYGSPERTAPIVDYEVNGVRYTYHHPTATLTNSRNHPIGSQIEVVYWPQNPELANLKEVVDNKLIDAVFFFVSFLFLLIPSLLYAMDYRRYHSRQE